MLHCTSLTSPVKWGNWMYQHVCSTSFTQLDFSSLFAAMSSMRHYPLAGIGGGGPRRSATIARSGPITPSPPIAPSAYVTLDKLLEKHDDPSSESMAVTLVAETRQLQANVPGTSCRAFSAFGCMGGSNRPAVPKRLWSIEELRLNGIRWR